MEKAKLKAFEVALDAELAALPSLTTDGRETLNLIANFHEVVAAQDRSLGSYVKDGAVIMAPHLIAGRTGPMPDVEVLAKDLQFAGHYYMLREYIYYSHNVPKALAWTFTSDRVEIRFLDRTIPRQFFTVYNDTLVGSHDLFSGFPHGPEIRRLLNGRSEWDQSPEVQQAFALIDQEVSLKLSAYFSLLPSDSAIDLGGYTYAQFMALYRGLLGKALYHRYHAELNDSVGAVFIGDEELAAAAWEESGLPADVTQAILADIVYDPAAVKARADASYYSLYREPGHGGRIVLRPHHFALAEGLVNLLRIIAQRRPQIFLDRLSNEIGSAFVRRAKTAWEAQGFICQTEVPLRDIDASLPDIDLLVISEEPTLGFVIFVCELKSPLPPRWAKDQLKVLNRDSVSKAFRQTEKIRAFLSTSHGADFIRRVVPSDKIPDFDGFVIAIQSLIITSDNAGMFFGHETTPIVNFRTLERLLDRSDGDVAYIQKMLAAYNQAADATLQTTVAEFEVAGRTVSYEAVTSSPVLDFPRVQWRSSPNRQAMIDAFKADGAHPFDALPVDPRSRPDWGASDGVIFIREPDADSK